MDKEMSTKQKDEMLSLLDSLISKYINNDDSRADKLTKWLKDYAHYLDFEKSFNPKKNKRYKRGEILKVNLGYNIGSEEGGWHYCAVLDKDNALSSPIITVIPLTSVKGELPQILPRSNIHIGAQIYSKLTKKMEEEKESFVLDSKKLLQDISSKNKDLSLSEAEIFSSRLDELASRSAQIERMEQEVSRMKIGSIALVGQITTVSKIRISDPKTKTDVLSGIRLDDKTLDKIDNKIKELFLK